MSGICISIVLIILAVALVWNIRCYLDYVRRRKLYYKYIPEVRGKVESRQFSEAYNIITTNDVLKWRYKLTDEQRKELALIEADCLVEIGRIKDAAIQLGNHIAAAYDFQNWPDDIFRKWLNIYKAAGPIEVELFYFCPHCGVHPKAMKMLDYIIDHGCEPPVGYMEHRKKPKPIIIEF